MTAAVEGALRSAADGSGRLVLIVGDAGAGKTWLAQQARDAAAAASVGRIMYAIKNGGAVAWGTKLSLGALVGKLEVAVLGVTSQPLAAALRLAVSTSNGVVAEVR